MGKWARRAALALALSSGLVQAGDPLVLWQRWIGPSTPQGWLGLGDGYLGSRAAAADTAGNLFVSGMDTNAGLGVVARLDAGTGAVRWENRPASQDGWVIAVGPDGNPVVAGLIAGSIAVIKYAGADGSILWRRDLPPATPGGVWDGPRTVEVDASGGVVVHAYEDRPARRGYVFKLGADGAPAWRFEDASVAAVAGNGDVYVVGPGIPGAFPGWAMLRLRGADGHVLWRSHQDEVGATDFAFSVTPGGDVIVAGRVHPVDLIGGWDLDLVKPVTMRTMRIAAADGATRWRWTREVPASASPTSFGSGSAGELAVAVDRHGAVFVTGQENLDMFTRRHAPETGAVQWEARHPSVLGTGSHGVGIAIDAAGDVVVTGVTGWWYSMAIPYGNVYSARYEGASGSLLWSATYDGTSGIFDSGWRVVPAGDSVYIVASTREGAAGSGIRAWKVGLGALPSPNHQGLWWASPAGSESGWGLGIAQQGDLLFATWFTYDDGGQPMWLVMPAMQRGVGDEFVGWAYRTRGPDFGADPFDPAGVRVEVLGSARLSLAADGSGTFRYTLYANPTVSQVKKITRQAFASPSPACAAGDPSAGSTNFTDLWWAAPAGSEPGWGLYVAHQGDVLFAAWFTYAGGNGAWFVAPELRRGADGRWAGALLRTTGPAFRAEPWDPARVTAGLLGTATLEFSDGLTGRFSYRVGEISQSKAIVRQSFALPGTDCR